MLVDMKYRINTLKKLNPYLYKIKRFFVLLTVSDIGNMLTALLAPYFYKILVDDVIINRRLPALVYVVLGYTSLFVAKLVFDFLINYGKNRLGNRLSINLKLKILKNYLGMPMDRYNTFQPGDLELRLNNDTDTLVEFVTSQTYTQGIAIITAAFSGIMLFTIHPVLAIYSMILIPATFYLGNIVGKAEEELSKKDRANDEAYNTWLHEGLQGWKEVRSLGLERRQRLTFTRFTHQSALYNAIWINYWVFRALVIPMIKDDLLMRFSLYFIGGIFIIKGYFSIGSLILFIQYYSIFYKKLNVLSDSNVELHKNIPLHKKVFDTLADNNPTEKKYTCDLSGDVTFDHVSYEYENRLGLVLDDISFSIRAGQHIAVVGKSGAGKSTLVKLILGLISASEGTIKIGKADISDITAKTLHKNIGVVMQDSILFNLSIKENLRLAKKSAGEYEIQEACRKAGLDPFIQGLPDKYDTLIGEKGIKLSGGQRQKIAIARIFLASPSIIIFDEATSALDSISEEAIHKYIKQLWADKTVIIIAHRLSSVLLADKVLILKNGKIAGFGHHSELYNINQAYDELFSYQ